MHKTFGTGKKTSGNYGKKAKKGVGLKNIQISKLEILNHTANLIKIFEIQVISEILNFVKKWDLLNIFSKFKI